MIFTSRHGDTVYLVPNTAPSQNLKNASPTTSNSIAHETSQKNSLSPDAFASSGLKEDEIDVYLMKQSGCIERQRDPKL